MNLRRRRRVRTLALAALVVAALVWAASIFFHFSWFSAAIPGTMPPERRNVRVWTGQIMLANRIGRDPGGLTFGVNDRPFSSFRILPDPRLHWWYLRRAGPAGGPWYFMANIPLWTPVALLLPPFLLTHWLARRPIARARRGLCHACAYDLNSTPPDHSCPECGTSRLAALPASGSAARTPRSPVSTQRRKAARLEHTRRHDSDQSGTPFA